MNRESVPINLIEADGHDGNAAGDVGGVKPEARVAYTEQRVLYSRQEPERQQAEPRK